MITPESPISRCCQAIAEATHDIIAPANVVDAAAFGLAMNAAPHLDTWGGIVKSAIAYGADLKDGDIARCTGTSSELGAKVDAVGDKLKLGWAMVHMVRLGVADTDLVATIAAQNIANALITGYDRARNEKPVITAAQPLGKKAMFGQAMALGIQVIGSKLENNHPTAGNTIKKAGRMIGFSTVATFGLASTIDYVRKARSGTKKVQINSDQTAVTKRGDGIHWSEAPAGTTPYKPL